MPSPSTSASKDGHRRLADLAIASKEVRPRQKNFSSKQIQFILLVIIFVLSALFWVWRSYTKIAVNSAAVSITFPSQAFTVLNATGYVVAERKASVASKATGRLEWLGVIEGSKVREGDVVARLENRDTEATRDQAAANVQLAIANLGQGKAELAEAEQAFKRSEALIGKNLITESAHDSAIARLSKARAAVAGYEAAVAVANANLRLAEVSLDQTLIRAPFDGVVLTRNANLGDTITPFSQAVDTKGAVVTIADLSTLEVEADVAESSYLRINVGQIVEIQLDAMPGKRFLGIVSRLVPTVDRAKASTLVKIRFLSPVDRALPDMSAKVAFLEREPTATERQPVIAIPQSAVLEKDGKSYVYIVENGVAHKRIVQLGIKINDLIAVSNLEPGLRVVIKPPQGLSDGRAVFEDAK